MTLVTLRKCTLSFKRKTKMIKLVQASIKGFRGGLAWIKYSKKDMAGSVSYSQSLKVLEKVTDPSSRIVKRTK